MKKYNKKHLALGAAFIGLCIWALSKDGSQPLDPLPPYAHDQRIHKKIVFRRENKGINNHALTEQLHFNNSPGYDDFVGVIAYQSPAGFPVVLYYEFELTRGLIYGRNFDTKSSTKQKAEQYD